MKNFIYLKTIMIWIMVIVTILWFYLLYIWSFIFIPLIISFFLFILLNWVYSFFYKILKKRYLSIIATIWIFLLFFIITWFIITTQVWSFLNNSTRIIDWLERLVASLESLWSSFWLDMKQYLNLDYLRKTLLKINYSAVGQNIYSYFTGFISLFWTAFIMFTFIFLERKDFKGKIRYLFDTKWEKKLLNIYEKVQQDLNVYFSAKFFLASINAVVATVIMTLFWLPFALTFWLIVFIMDFVPIVWALIALWLPFLYSFVVFDSIGTSFLLLLCLDIPQVMTWNFVEPRIMWQKLNISTIFIVISLLFWSQLWGIVGAFIATPIIVAINIALSRFEATNFISVILSKNYKKNSKN